MTISANVRTPEQLFGRSVRYVVPAYQRRYVWNEKDQWEPLWEDVERLADEYLNLIGNGKPQVSDDDAPKHFLGAVVFQQEVTPTGTIEIRRVIDGQQRLTTLQILLDAVQEVYDQQEHDLEARRLRRLVLNDELDTGGNEVSGYKVWPSANDQLEFRFAMRNDATGPRPESSLIVDAHDYFKEQVSRWLTEQAELEPAVAGLSVVLARMIQLVVIDLDADAEPQVIFETLNARGTPLLQADLVRNYMIYKARAEGLDEDSFNAKWLLPLSTEWWQEEVQFGRLLRARFEQFMFYWIIMRTAETMKSSEEARDIRVDDVFRRFQNHVDREDVEIEDVAADIQRCAEVFRDLTRIGNGSSLSRWSSYLHSRVALSINVDAPLLMWLFTQDVSQSEVDRCLKALESWVIRRLMYGRRMQNDNRVVPLLISRMAKRSEEETVSQVLLSFLQDQKGLLKWPSDAELVTALTRYKSYGRLSRTRVVFLLERLEQTLRSSNAELLALPRSLQIEHIMPKKWERHWELTKRRDPGFPDLRAFQDHTVDCLGNLTLVTSGLNASVSNGPWKRKRDALSRHSVLFLNKDVLEHAHDEWAIPDIRGRSKRLANVAVEIWPGPDKF